MTDGVRRDPSSLTMTLASLPSMTATTLLVVPRSMPMILPMMLVLLTSPPTYARVTFHAMSCVAAAHAHFGGRLREVVTRRQSPRTLRGARGREREQHNHRPRGVNGT